MDLGRRLSWALALTPFHPHQSTEWRRCAGGRSIWEAEPRGSERVRIQGPTLNAQANFTLGKAKHAGAERALRGSA